MAQQTINIGASPNDGTGTPLRTAFQYTNSNFSELYTAVGPSGNNIVVPGNATITGDLTVRTNVISATSSGVGFGINTAAAAVDVVSSFQWRSNTGGTDKLAIFSGGAGLIYLGSTTASALSWLYNGSEAMRLNSTGLGVGAVAANGIKLAAYVATDGAPATSGTTQTSGSLRIGAASTVGVMDMGTAGSYSWIQPCNATNLATNYNLVLNPNGGNVGIGVTPTNKLTIGTGTFNASTASGSASLYSTVANGLVVLADGMYVATRAGVNRLIVDTSGNIISNVTSTAPSLTDNGFMVFNLTSNTNLRISVRGSDGVTRTADLTLA